MADTKSKQREILAKISKEFRKLIELVKEDPRYKIEAYVFVERAFRAAQAKAEAVTEETEPVLTADGEPVQHMSVRDLCEALRCHAVDQFGFMAKLVLESWGVRSTSDFGEIVFNMIRIGQFHKSPHDRRADFDGVYDFEEVFCRRFQITRTE